MLLQVRLPIRWISVCGVGHINVVQFYLIDTSIFSWIPTVAKSHIS